MHCPQNWNLHYQMMMHLMLPRDVLWWHTFNLQSTLAECSAVLALLPPQEDQQIVCKVPIPHPEVNLVGQSQDHDLGDNNL